MSGRGVAGTDATMPGESTASDHSEASMASKLADDSATMVPVVEHPNRDRKALNAAAKLAKKKKAEKKAAAAAAAADADADAKNAVPNEQKKRDTPSQGSLQYTEETPPGEKKVLKPLEDAHHKAYVPIVVESAWYEWWEKQGFFLPQVSQEDNVAGTRPFVIAAPPPNVTGALHCGHALAISLIRWSRMKGLVTLWIPGCDHAGISTQSVVEKMLWRRQKLTRHDLGRTKFVELVQDWKTEYHEKINIVLRRMGGSYDWSREAFTMDQNFAAAVTEAFCRLYDEGCIYRSNRLVNWCVHLNTALSNLEVTNKDLPGRTLLEVPGYDRKVEFGVLFHFNYPINGLHDVIEVATSRPETMLGDTGIAVHPADKRYAHLIGKLARHPFLDRLLPIVADEHVDPGFGAGAVKITPAHDQNDFDIGTRHGLQLINVINDNGVLNENAGPFKGQKRFDARYSVIEELKRLDLFVKKTDNPMKVPLCEKSQDVIEPLMKPQWWMKMRDISKHAMDATRNGNLKILPEAANKSFYRWMENVNDWCLSRQLWWGHQAPAYFIQLEDEANDSVDNGKWVVGRTEEEAMARATKKFPGKKFTLLRDPDVLDTWFSSGLWPFAILGWPRDTEDMSRFYPTTILETGWDILFFWVARMVMLGHKLTGQLPFTEVYCHSLVRDTEGRKMSKSLGNVIDPMDVINGIALDDLHAKLLTGNLDPKEVKTAIKFQKTAFPSGIPECGTDALRFCLIQYCTGGGDISFDIQVMHGYRRFCNKIYQATKYALGNLYVGYTPPRSLQKSGRESLVERWILHKLNTSARDINRALEDREFSKATQIVYQYWYKCICDVFIENSKLILQSPNDGERNSMIDTLYNAIEGALTMIHPFMPYLSEELWQRLPRRPGDSTPSIMTAKYPQYDAAFEDQDADVLYGLLLGCSRAVRSLLAQYDIRSSKAKSFILVRDAPSRAAVLENLPSIVTLSENTSGELTIDVISQEIDVPLGCAVVVVSSSVSVYVDIKGYANIGQEIEKIESKLVKTSRALQKARAAIGAPGFTQKSSAAVQEVERQRLTDLIAEEHSLRQTIELLRKVEC